jgi:hypothetical protein
MADRKMIQEEELESVNGGQITYCWNGETGSLGMNGNNTYRLLDKAAFLKVYNEMFGKFSDAEIIKELRNQGIIKKP